MNNHLYKSGRRGDRGAVISMVAIMMVVVVALAALAIDLSHLMVVKNELQNAADAGALNGARVLYNDAGTAINTNANQEAYNAATANKSVSTAGTIAVDVNWTSGNTGDVQRGHWSFGLGNLARGFYPNDSTAPIDLWNKSTVDLDEDTDFINAVRVVARRDATRAASFFAPIFGYQDFALSAEAVAYIGFAGTIKPHEVDLPIAICKQSILIDDEYRCSFGRMLNSGSSLPDHNTAGWTNFVQPCSTANTTSLREVLDGCAGNPDIIKLGQTIGTTGGVIDNIINHPSQPNITSCWRQGRYDSDGDDIPDASIDTDGNGVPDQPWSVSLPVIDCPGNNVGNCSEVKGSVTVDVVWILEDENKIDTDAPYKMGNWLSSDPNGINRWNSFVNHFNLQLLTAIDTFSPATYENGGFKKKSVYFLPNCEPHIPAGITGGENFGVLAKIPVLVK